MSDNESSELHTSNKKLMFDLVPVFKNKVSFVSSKIEGVAVSKEGEIWVVNDNLIGNIVVVAFLLKM